MLFRVLGEYYRILSVTVCFVNLESWVPTGGGGGGGGGGHGPPPPPPPPPPPHLRLNGTPPLTLSNKYLYYLTLSQYSYPYYWHTHPPPPPPISRKAGGTHGSAHLLVSVGYVCDDEYNTVQDNINSPICLITWWPCCLKSY